MTDIEICQRDDYNCYLATAKTRGLAKKMSEKYRREITMTAEILYLTTRIHQWLNVQVARHLAAQAEKLAR
jgi:hypothetical protein